MAQDDNNTPPPPFGSQGDFPNGNGEPIDLDAGKPAVASAPSRIFVILGAGGVFVALVFYFILFGGGSKEAPPPKSSIQPSEISKITPPPPPPPPASDAPPPIPSFPSGGSATVTPPPIPQVPVITDDSPTDETRLQHIRSPMVIINNSGSNPLTGGGDTSTSASNDPNSSFANKVQTSEAKKAKATRLGNIDYIIAQGKVVHAVLETAINTQLPGTIRAITSRDTYAESGREVLVPKGSRLIGVYNTDVFQGQARVFIVWTRIIRPDGIDIKVDSPGVDQLGRAGLPGAVDTKFPEILTSAVLTSAISIGIAFAADSIDDGGDTTSTTNTDGSTTTSGSAVSQASGEAVTRIGAVAGRALDRLIDTRPTITVDQGTRINVLVNQDLLFPNLAANGVTIP